MSSGEADRVLVTLVQSGSLDAFTRCRVAGCEWNVQLPEMRCERHGGRAVPAYFADAEGAIVSVRHMPQRDGL